MKGGEVKYFKNFLPFKKLFFPNSLKYEFVFLIFTQLKSDSHLIMVLIINILLRFNIFEARIINCEVC